LEHYNGNSGSFVSQHPSQVITVCFTAEHKILHPHCGAPVITVWFTAEHKILHPNCGSPVISLPPGQGG